MSSSDAGVRKIGRPTRKVPPVKVAGTVPETHPMVEILRPLNLTPYQAFLYLLEIAAGRLNAGPGLTTSALHTAGAPAAASPPPPSLERPPAPALEYAEMADLLSFGGS